MEIKHANKRKLKAELDFFKIYAIFVVGLVTGDVSLLKDYIITQSSVSFILLIIGTIALFGFIGMSVISFFKIRKLIK